MEQSHIEIARRIAEAIRPLVDGEKSISPSKAPEVLDELLRAFASDPMLLVTFVAEGEKAFRTAEDDGQEDARSITADQRIGRAVGVFMRVGLNAITKPDNLISRGELEYDWLGLEPLMPRR